MPDNPAQPRAFTDVLPPQAREEFRHLELRARRIVDGLLHGLHRSRRLGVSTDFAHHKNYVPGDPLKHMDWKASARLDRFFIKRYQEDRSLVLHLVLDRSASMRQATAGAAKYWHACRLAAALAYLVLKERDAASLRLAAPGTAVSLPSSSSSSHLVRLLRALLDSEAAKEDYLSNCLRAMADRALRRGIVGVISDLMFDPVPVQREFGRLLAQGHEVLLFQVRDPTEEDFPFNRWVQFGDLENAAVKHRLDAVTLKRLYREEYQALLDNWRGWTRQHGVHLVSFRTDQRVEKVLSDYVAYRMRIS